MKKKAVLFAVIMIFSGFFLLFCEKEEVHEMETNKLKFSEIQVDSVSYREANVSYKLENLDKNNVESLGICYNTSNEPTKEDNTVTLTTDTLGTKTIDSLSPDTEYYFRLYAEISGTPVYSADKNFSTNPLGTPAVSTGEITDATATSAVCEGNVTDKNGSDVIAKGICWNKSGSPKTSDNKTDEGESLGEFSSNLENLDINTIYYVRGYATNEIGTAYGQELSFSTEDGIPELTTSEATDIVYTDATAGGNITDNGGLSVTARGVCWNTTGSPTTGDNITEDGSGTGSFTSAMEGLSPNTTYYVRAYATNALGTYYGTEKTFTTLTRPPGQGALPVN